MISEPTTPQLIEAVCAELESKVGPAIEDGPTKVLLEMALAVLRGASVRSANELAWMAEEAEAIEAVARRLVAELPDATALAEALEIHNAGKARSRYLAEAQEEYERASELLSCAAEAAYLDGNAERIAAIVALYDQRLANENAVTGVFLAAGRS
jgi:hypothetical protein